MAFYMEEEDVWKCPKHPSKRRRSGICPTCLRERLNTLCPDCANVRPCSCCSTATTTSSSSSSSSSFSLFSDASKSGRVVGRVSSLIDSEPAFRRSRSVAIPFLRSRFSGDSDIGSLKPTPPGTNRTSKSSFWSVFKTQTKNNIGYEEREDGELKKSEIGAEDNYKRRVMMRSRSVSVPVTSISGTGDSRSSATKGRGWHFPSPISVFRHSKTSKVVQERSPLYRG